MNTMKHTARICLIFLATMLMLAAASPLRAASSVIVIVNDQPITNHDVEQRIKIEDLLGNNLDNPQGRKAALSMLVDDVLKRTEAKRIGAMPGETQVNATLTRIAKNIKTDFPGLNGSLKERGIDMDTLRTQVATTMAFNRMLSSKYQLRQDVDPAEVDRRMAQLATDPRMKPVTIFNLQEVVLPVENVGAMKSQLMMARAMEAQQVMQNYRGCASVRKASSGIFNVRVGKSFSVPADKLPKELKAALEKAGTSRLVGPMQGDAGIQLLGLCSKKTVTPPAPTRETVENMIIDEKYAAYATRFLRELRRTAVIDYKDKSFQPKD